MQARSEGNEFDAIVVGTGASGASVARGLARHRKKVLMLERGGNAPLKGGLRGLMSIISTAPVGDNIETARAVTTGGTTTLYFAAARLPPLESFRALGIDLANALDEVRKELPLAPLRDDLLSAQVIKVRQSALQLGYSWTKTDAMLIDQSKCNGACSDTAKWTARNYVRDAVAEGATLINHATVTKVLIENNRAVGVEYQLGKQDNFAVRQAYGAKIVLAAGALASPIILRRSGAANIANRGFYCDPNFLVMAHVKGLKGGELFPGSMGAGAASEAGGLLLGDGCLSRAFYRAFMLGNGKFMRLFSHSNCIAVGVMVTDGLGGELRQDGRYHKQFTAEEAEKLARGGQLAEEILRNAGGKRIFRGGLTAAHVGGVVRIGEHLDARLETEYRNLHVCDGSVIPETIRLPPTLTLICLGKYLAHQLVQQLQRAS